MSRAILLNLIALGLFALGLVIFLYNQQFLPSSSPQSEISAAYVSQATSSELIATSSISTSVSASTTAPVKKPTIKAVISASTTTDDEVARIENPYSTAPESFSQINTDGRSALVNILCQPQGGSLQPISGSGVIIDSRGVILTNAHVAQYILLSESPQIDLSCIVRTGSPARAEWKAIVLYIPPIWVNEHASEILEQHPTGTGEHDYALLYIVGSVGNNPLPTQFPSLPIDTRAAIGFPGDEVLVASYPAELIGGVAAQYDLYAASSETTIKQLLTFSSGTPDLLSLGGIIEAQGGSSGGEVLNAWGRLIGLIVTTSSGTTTADRDLRAVALSYIDTDLKIQSGESLSTLLEGSPDTESKDFSGGAAASLISLYLPYLSANH